MPNTRYGQFHRKLLFHWTGPRPIHAVRTRADRDGYLDLMAKILSNGLKFSVPNAANTEWIERDDIRAAHPMLSFSEWGIADSGSHSGRYGFMGLGFTRKFMMRVGGRPVVYVPNTRSDPFRKAMIEVIRAAREGRAADSKLHRHADLLASYLKAYHFKRLPPSRPSDVEPPQRRDQIKPPARMDDHHLRLDFGGVFANLEDREWRVLSTAKATVDDYLSFQPGELAMIVFPDHQTLSLAMQHDDIRAWINRPDKPSVSLLSREMIMSI